MAKADRIKAKVKYPVNKAYAKTFAGELKAKITFESPELEGGECARWVKLEDDLDRYLVNLTKGEEVELEVGSYNGKQSISKIFTSDKPQSKSSQTQSTTPKTEVANKENVDSSMNAEEIVQDIKEMLGLIDIYMPEVQGEDRRAYAITASIELWKRNR